MNPDRPNGLLAWQWDLYPHGHHNRLNLILHLLTVPLFHAGTLAILAAPFVSWLLAPAGSSLMAAALGIQGRGHRDEPNAPVKFDSAFDALARLCVENWITFPRFVLSGRFAAQYFSAQPNLDLRESPAPCAPSSFSTSNTKISGSSNPS